MTITKRDAIAALIGIVFGGFFGPQVGLAAGFLAIVPILGMALLAVVLIFGFFDIDFF